MLVSTLINKALTFLKAAAPWLPAAALLGALCLQPKELSVAMYEADNKRVAWWAPQLKSLKKGEYFRFEKNGQVYRLIGLNPAVSCVTGPITDLFALYEDEYGVAMGTSSSVRVFRTKGWK